MDTSSKDTQPDIQKLPSELQQLYQQVSKASLPPNLLEKTEQLIVSLQRLIKSPQYHAALDDTVRYIDWMINLPWNTVSQDNLDLEKAQEILDSTHHSLQVVKERILEYIAVLALQNEAEKRPEHKKALEDLYQRGIGRAPVLLFVGLPGVGKTSIVHSIAKALNRKFVRIPMGGMGSASQLRGNPATERAAEPGAIIKALRQAQTKNPVILLDEIDRVAESVRSDIMGVLLELLDPQQNIRFTDYFINYPFDLTSVMFICSANNTRNIANAVLNRMEVIQMPGYNDEEKIVIARDYLLPQQLLVSGMDKNDVVVDEAVWPIIVRPLGYDAGVRSVARVVEAIVRKCARQRVSGGAKTYRITEENYKDFVPEPEI